MGLLLHPGSAIEIVSHNSDMDGRVISAKLKLNEQTFQVINVYASNKHSDRETFFLVTFGVSHFAMLTLSWQAISIACPIPI